MPEFFYELWSLMFTDLCSWGPLAYL